MKYIGDTKRILIFQSADLRGLSDLSINDLEMKIIGREGCSEIYQKSKMTTVSDKKMMDKMELQIKGLEKNMGTIVKALKDIKAGLTALEEKVNKSQNEEIQHIVVGLKK